MRVSREIFFIGVELSRGFERDGAWLANGDSFGMRGVKVELWSCSDKRGENLNEQK